MNLRLLEAYIDMILSEDGLARVPNQLLDPNDDDQDDVDETSGAGAVCGSMMKTDSDRDR